jgi:hypothetical protein
MSAILQSGAMELRHPSQMLSAPDLARLIAASGPLKPAPRLPDLPATPDALGDLRSALAALVGAAQNVNPPFDERAPLHRYLAQGAYCASAFHLGVVAGLLSEEVCGLVAAATARAMLDDALLWAWISVDRGQRETALGKLASLERTNLEAALSSLYGARSLVSRRWLPAAPEELDAYADPAIDVPEAFELVEQVASKAVDGPVASTLRFQGLRTAASVLSVCGHFSAYSALWTPLPLKNQAERGYEYGGRLVPQVEALVAHVASAAVAAIALATDGVHPGREEAALPTEELSRLALEVALVASSIHGLGGPTASSATGRVCRGFG